MASHSAKLAFLSACSMLTSVSAGALSTGTYTSANCDFPDTGQKTCYNATISAGCPAVGAPFYGQDGNYMPSSAQLSYTRRNVGGMALVTVDNRTGLVWTSTEANNGNPAASWSDALAICENLTFAGYSDWRLPNVRELMSIVNYGASGAPFVNISAFPGTQSGYYWSSTVSAMNPVYAWDIGFHDGLVMSEQKTSALPYVRCVRGGPP